MARETLSAGVWLCVNPGASYASGVEVTINVEKTTASLRYEWKSSDTIAPTYIDDISEPIQSLSVKAVDGKGFLWLLSQSVEVDVQIETITPAFSSITFPSGMASETKQDDQIAELQAIAAAIQDKKQVGYARVEDANGDEFNQVSTIDASPSPPVMTVYYFDDSGVQQTPVAPINVINTKQIASDMLYFKAIVATANYAIGDTLTKRTILTDGAKTGSFWTNETTDLPISAPPSTDYEQSDDVVFIKAIGDPTDSSQTDETQDATLISLAKGTIETLKAQTLELNTINELNYREAHKDATTYKTWAQYEVIDITGWSVGVLVGDFVYKEIDQLSNTVQWLKSDGATVISAPLDLDENVDQLSADKDIEVVYESIYATVVKTRTPTIKKGINNFGFVVTEGEWV